MGIKRITNIAQVLTEEGLGFLIAGQGNHPSSDLGATEAPTKDVAIAARFRKVCERLGPTFIKFGQVLALRRDVFSDAFCAELGKLHSSVPPFASAEAVRIIETELTAKISDVFCAFDENPVAAASIAQVHFATLVTGEQVAVKVQRPDAGPSIRDDLDMILSMSKWLDRLFSTYREAMVHGMAQEFATMTAKELNFLEEASVAVELKAALAVEPDVYIPTIYRKFCTTRVLVLERLVGHRLDHFKSERDVLEKGFDPKKIAKTMLKLQIRQAYEIGLLHADMHPGNVFILEGGRVGLIDFGMNIRVTKETREGMQRALRLRASGRYEECFDVFLTVFSTPPEADVRAMKKELIAFARANDAKPLSEMSLGKALIEESRIGRKYGATGPADLMIIARGLLTVEGIALHLCPGFSPYAELHGIFSDLTRERFTPGRMASTWSELLPDFVEALEMTPELSKTLFRVRRNLASTNGLAEFLEREGFFARPGKGSNRNAGGALILAAVIVGYLLAWLQIKFG